MGICPQAGLTTCVIGCCSADTRRSAAVLGRPGWHDASGGVGSYGLTARPSPGLSRWKDQQGQLIGTPSKWRTQRSAWP